MFILNPAEKYNGLIDILCLPVDKRQEMAFRRVLATPSVPPGGLL